ncbi:MULTISPECIES: HD domain-containing protein [unclassified Ruegeria]|uniref:HD domain-containing protein n=1 Tax=unclassified Ruegeria TaxID=2625375 RepID=UPI001ADAAD09|nr:MULTISPECIES: HD domain-containing protein [unclassified Ruegeria]MBO9413673.1 HD domain-containing protein [Ruegeria sp. R8_1]MBO9417720.1 HD domain-containing protein [Ruegeria sp. R8_2]
MATGYDVKFTSVLERKLEKDANREDVGEIFPSNGINIFDCYKTLKARVNDEYLRDVQAGLTADTQGEAAFTRHDIGHVDDVIRIAGELMGAGSSAKTPVIEKLKPYENFVLLCACLVHDAGNVEGRDEHERRARKVLRAVSKGILQNKEIKVIAAIAAAHGGKNPDRSKGKIERILREDGVAALTVRQQLLAGLLRFADELAENNRRASRLDNDASRFHNLYCECIHVHVNYEARWIKLDFELSEQGCELKGSPEGREEYFVDYLKSRVIKTELERRYCDRFIRGFCSFEEVRVTIEWLYDEDVWKTEDFVLRESGFPTDEQNVWPDGQELSGEIVASEYKKMKACKNA